VYLPGFFTIPPVDRDESRFAQASRQMFESVALPAGERDAGLHSGGLVVPMVASKPRLNKPPLIYWLQAASAAAFTGGDPLRDAIWMYRVPSLLAGIVTVLATWRMGLAMFDPRAGWLGAALLAVAPVFVWEAHQARADMVMVAFTTLAVWQLRRIWRGGVVSERAGALRAPRAAAPLLWLFTALGILTKGPITPMVIVLTALSLSVLAREFRWLRATRPLLGALVVLGGVAPWVYLVAERVGFAEYWGIVYGEVLGRAGSAREGHWGPPGYHLVLLVVLFWPGSLLTALAVGRAFRRGLRGSWRRIRAVRSTRRPEAFLLAWLVPSWIVFELSFTKLPHYTMPLYPAVAMLTARGVFAAMSSALPGVAKAVHRLGFALWCVPGLLITFGLGAAAYSSLGGHWNERPSALLLWSLQIVSLGAVIVAIGALRRGAWLGVHLCGGLIMVCLSVGLLGGYLSRVERVWFTTELVEKARSAGGGPIASSGFQEDSLVYLTRGRIEFVRPEAEVAWWAANLEGVMIMPREQVGRVHTVVGEVEGLRYTKGRVEQLAVVKRWEPTGD